MLRRGAIYVKDFIIEANKMLKTEKIIEFSNYWCLNRIILNLSDM